jgi:sec-independent protein translocase protein TatB
MFDFDIGKMIVFGIVALAVIPPKDLPRVMRTVGKYVGQMRRMAADFRGQFDAALKEVELESIKKEIDEINDAAKVDTSFDPAALMRDNIEKAVQDKPAVYEETKPAVHVQDEPSAYQMMTVEPSAALPEPEAVEMSPSVPQKAASSAT